MPGDEHDGLDDEEKDRLRDIVDDLNRDVQQPPYDNDAREGYSREYKEYREEEIQEQENNRFEQLCIKMGSALNMKAGERTQETLTRPLRLLDWDVTPGMVLSAAVGVGFLSFVGWFLLFILNFALGSFIPTSIMLLSLVIPLAAGVYTYYHPVYEAKNKVIRSSGEMILSILYMVVYMRSSPNLEGAVRFAALNLDGPISDDLKGVLWDLEVGNYNRIEEALEEYTRRWKGYNDDYLESLQLLQAAMNDPNSDRREKLLQDSIDRILDGTREKMKHYAQSLKTPVMILNAMGAMLPVLGMIMLPLISVFMGGVIRPMHLILLFNFMLPGFLYWFMQRILSSRPPTVSSDPVSTDALPSRGRYTLELFGNSYDVPAWPFGVLVFFVVALFGLAGYVAAPFFYPVQEVNLNMVPSIFRSGDSLAPLPMLMRSVSITLGLGWGIGVTKLLGNIERRDAEEHLRNIEQQFPTALFQLGNKISGGTPIELALEDAADATSDLEISDLFRTASRNIKDMGMTFEEAVFNEKYGALYQFPSQMIQTVMQAILESSEKGTNMAAMAMTTISRYLENIHETQEKLNDLMEETTTTIEMLAYLLAPVVSGVAVGMSQTIITAMFKLGQSFQESQASLPSGGAQGTQFAGILGNLDSAIPPELLQFVVGIYLIQLLYILATFYMKITEGENKTYRNMFVGKVLISGMFFYTITLVIVGLLFGGIVSGISTGV
ncbi:MAG: type II secretion system F family protein [Candidatus Nanohaloarchaea archaeon]